MPKDHLRHATNSSTHDTQEQTTTIPTTQVLTQTNKRFDHKRTHEKFKHIIAFDAVYEGLDVVLRQTESTQRLPLYVDCASKSARTHTNIKPRVASVVSKRRGQRRTSEACDAPLNRKSYNDECFLLPAKASPSDPEWLVISLGAQKGKE